MIDSELYRGSCPYCGEAIDLFIDPGADEQSYVEDCSVCCNPIDVRISLTMSGDRLVDLNRQDF